jgi:hypothetical protein
VWVGVPYQLGVPAVNGGNRNRTYKPYHDNQRHFGPPILEGRTLMGVHLTVFPSRTPFQFVQARDWSRKHALGM